MSALTNTGRSEALRSPQSNVRYRPEADTQCFESMDSKGLEVTSAAVPCRLASPELEAGYKALRTSDTQRKSYRAHVLNAVQSLITVSDTNFNATPDKDPGEEAVGIEEAIDVNIGDDAPDPAKLLDIGRETPEKEETEDDKESKELEDFVIKGEDKTGAAAAMASMKQIENVIKKTYNSLYDPNDRDLYSDYLITNLQLYFDEFEKELQAVIPEPENPDYEERKAADAGLADTGIQSEDNDPL